MTVYKCPDCEKEIPENETDCTDCKRKPNHLDDFRMRFETLIEDIKHTKDRQWTITYYILLLYSGLIALGTNTKKGCYGIEILLGAFGLFILIFGGKYLNSLIDSIKDYRKYLWKHVLPKMTIYKSELEILKERYKRKKNNMLLQDDEKLIDYHISAKDSKIWGFRTILVSAFILQLFFMKDFIHLMKDLFSWAFNC